MKTFDYTVTAANGIHGRPAGNLVKLAGTFKSTIIIKKGDVSNDLTMLMAVMSMGVRKGDTVTITIEGPDEQIAANAVEEFFKQNL